MQSKLSKTIIITPPPNPPTQEKNPNPNCQKTEKKKTRVRRELLKNRAVYKLNSPHPLAMTCNEDEIQYWGILTQHH